MTPEELILLLAYVKEHHNVHNNMENVRIVKYVDPHFDNRTGDIFSIGFRGFGWKRSIYTSNEQVVNPKSLYDRCIQFLQTPYGTPISKFEKGDTVKIQSGEYMTVCSVNTYTDKVYCQWFDSRTVYEQWFDSCELIKVPLKEVEKLKKALHTSSS
jgi:uncharacterized protein YodC (DUF2158 family)